MRCLERWQSHDDCKILQASNITDRKIFLYDTFEGMSEPTADDKNYKGKDAREMMDATDRTKADSVWCYSPLEEVQENMKQTGYPKDRVVFVKGKVEETIPVSYPLKSLCCGWIPIGMNLLITNSRIYFRCFQKMEF